MKTLLNLTRAALWVGVLAGACTVPASAASLALAKSFEGNINFVGTQASLQSKTGGAKACDLMSSAQADISLPSSANVVSATLYWAGSGTIDPTVSLNGATVTALAERRFSSSIDGLNYFAAAADVTSEVQGKTSFTFGGLTVATTSAYCSNKPKDNAVLAGFSLVVVYSRTLEKYRTVNLYEGFQALKNTSVTVPMRDYTPNLTSTDAGRFGYIVWEGDKTGQQKGDWVSFAGQVMQVSPYAQKDNAFNSKSGANFDQNSGGIDFDIFELGTLPTSASNANAVFTTESDRVLLSAAIVALPSAPADLAIQKTQSGEFKLGNEVKYTLTVSNLGSRADSKVTVKDILPDALSYVSALGADWSCSVAGKTVTCSYGKPLAAGSSASVVITAKVAAEGKIANTAEVFGTADGVPGNNKSTVEGDTNAGQAVKDPYVFTVGECSANTVIKQSGDGCALFKGPVVAGETPRIYVTRNVDGVATPFSTTAASAVSMSFALECNNPTGSAGVTARYLDADLPACLGNGVALTGTNGLNKSVSFAAGKPSVLATFRYLDVGLVTLRVRDAAGKSGAATFLSRPESIRAAYTRVDGDVANPGTDTLAGVGFAEAGEPFRATVSAYGIGGLGPLPNFGNESGTDSVANALTLKVAGNQAGGQFLKDQDAWSKRGNGIARTYAWDEVGAASLQPSLSGYLEYKSPFVGVPEKVGRFYPAYFITETEGGFACLKRMACPSAAPGQLSLASFSGQKFDVVVRAFGRNGEVQGFDGALVPDIALETVRLPGDDARLGDLTENPADKKLKERKVSYQLGIRYLAAEGRTSGWTAPTAVYVRASIDDKRLMPGGAQASVKVSSKRAAGSVEGGMMIVNGRLMVGNALGTPLAKTPVPLRAQYWSGQAWEQNGLIDEEQGAGSVTFSGCTRSLRPGGPTAAPGGCATGILKLASGEDGTSVALPKLVDGRSVLWLGAVPADKSGNVDLLVTGLEWLPSTLGRVTFGQFKSPVIYVRELY